MTAINPDMLLAPGASAEARANLSSVLLALERYGARAGLDQPHRLAHYLAQLSHESAGFRHDSELWGPTPAQERYDTRTDLGNSFERDGDGKLYRGRTTIQITGKANYRAFRDWCRAEGLVPPDFVATPDLVNTDPWEGLAPIWFWSTRLLNRYADINDPEMITRRINGGLNGYADRLAAYTRIGLILLGYGIGGAGALSAFQTTARANGLYDALVDGIDGPRTRAAIHKMLVARGTVRNTAPAPVTAPVPPEGAERTAPLNTGVSLVGVGTVINAFGQALGGLHPVAQGGALLLVAVGVVVVWRDRARIAALARGLMGSR